jgi:hypothetical protein
MCTKTFGKYACGHQTLITVSYKKCDWMRWYEKKKDMDWLTQQAVKLKCQELTEVVLKDLDKPCFDCVSRGMSQEQSTEYQKWYDEIINIQEPITAIDTSRRTPFRERARVAKDMVKSINRSRSATPRHMTPAQDQVPSMQNLFDVYQKFGMLDSLQDPKKEEDPITAIDMEHPSAFLSPRTPPPAPMMRKSGETIHVALDESCMNAPRGHNEHGNSTVYDKPRFGTPFQDQKVTDKRQMPPELQHLRGLPRLQTNLPSRMLEPTDSPATARLADPFTNPTPPTVARHTPRPLTVIKEERKTPEDVKSPQRSRTAEPFTQPEPSPYYAAFMKDPFIRRTTSKKDASRLRDSVEPGTPVANNNKTPPKADATRLRDNFQPNTSAVDKPPSSPSPQGKARGRKSFQSRTPVVEKPPTSPIARIAALARDSFHARTPITEKAPAWASPQLQSRARLRDSLQTRTPVAEKPPPWPTLPDVSRMRDKPLPRTPPMTPALWSPGASSAGRPSLNPLSPSIQDSLARMMNYGSDRMSGTLTPASPGKLFLYQSLDGNVLGGSPTAQHLAMTGGEFPASQQQGKADLQPQPLEQAWWKSLRRRSNSTCASPVEEGKGKATRTPDGKFF